MSDNLHDNRDSHLSIRSSQSMWDGDPDRLRCMLLLDVARQYYEFGMSQAEIAHAKGYSRPTVGRMLAEAKTQGIVRIQITHPLERVIELENTIRNRFGIEHVRVSSGKSQRDGILEVAMACAALLDSVVKPDSSIGISNGRVHAALVEHISHRRYPDVNVVQMVGGLEDSSRLIDTAELCRRLARNYDGTAQCFSAPMLARTEQLARDLRATAEVSRTLTAAANVDIAVIGVGAGFRFPAGVFDGLISRETVRDLHRQGAVGHVLGRFVDAYGATVDTSLESRVIGLTLQALRKIPLVVAVASGAQKAPAIAATLRGKYVDALILDIGAAQAVAHLPETHSRRILPPNR